MKARILLVCGILAVLLATPVHAPAASKEIMELQRDIALLQQKVNDLQRSQDEKFAAVTELARQAIEAANRANTGVAVIQSSLDKNLKELQSSVAAPVVGLNSRLNDISNNVGTLTQAVSDLTSTLNHMQTQLGDIKKQVEIINQPPPAPQQTGGAAVPGGTTTGGMPAAPAPCPTSADSAYGPALTDYRGGKYDLAFSEFSDYLRCFGNTALAPNAQFYIAMIHYTQGQFEKAVSEFDTVLEKYGDSNKAPESFYYKGRALAQSGQRTAATNEWIELIRRYPRDPASKMACEDLKAFGKNCPAPPVTSTKKGGSSRKK